MCRRHSPPPLPSLKERGEEGPPSKEGEECHESSPHPLPLHFSSPLWRGWIPSLSARRAGKGVMEVGMMLLSRRK